VYWDNIAVVEGNFQGDYFDGDGTDTADPPVEYAWTGTPHNSSSTWRTGYIVQVPDEERYDEIIFNLGRNLHSVTCISGPLVEQKLHRGALWGYVVEFTLAAGVPYIFGETRSVDAGDQIPVVVQDVPFNLVPYPSAELASGTVTAATNFSNNPSVELDLTNWSSAASSVTAQTVLSQGDSTAGGLASVGTKSAKARFTAVSAGSAGTLRVDNTSATFTATVAGDRMSVNMWATPILVSGTAVLGTLNIYAIWRAGSTVLSTDLVGAAPSGGGAVSKKSMPVPATATNVIIRAELNLTSWSIGAVVDLYADAVAITRP